MKKKQRCFVKRFAALVAALMLCASLCVPAFASNNAQWRKWVIVDERNMTNEQGTESKYFRLTPFQNGSVYAAVFRSRFAYGSVFTSADSSSDYSDYSYSAFYVDNYPDWWRSAIPLGSVSYLQVDVKSFGYSNSPLGTVTPISSGKLYSFDSLNSLFTSLYSDARKPYFSGSLYSSGSNPVFLRSFSTSVSYYSADSIDFAVGDSLLFSPNGFYNLGFGGVFSTSDSRGLGVVRYSLSNLSSDRLVLVFSKSNPDVGTYYHATAEISFWVDANKLPAGLKVGDEFPADTDAFDKLRDELLDQFPEAADNIENGKATIQGWNDTETVDSDVASTSISALNGMFQNLGQFLFIVSLMVFGAVVLRMLIRKAVDG